MLMVDTKAIESALSRHQRVALQLSGGRDSVAALYAMHPWWDRLTVYHLDTGDEFPEVTALVQAIAQDVPVEIIRSNVHEVHARIGLPSDLVPADNEPLGRMVGGATLALTSRFTCCWHTIMAPMHQRMLDDGVTLMVRGQRSGDYVREPAPAGLLFDGVELLFPIHRWSDAQVDEYVAGLGLPMPSFYAEGMHTTPDCMACTAWLGDGRHAYMRHHHPERASQVAIQIRTIRRAVEAQLANFNEVES